MNSIQKKFSITSTKHQKTYLISTLSIIIVAISFIILSTYFESQHVELYLNTLTVIAVGFAFWASLRVLNRQKWILYKLLKASWFYISIGFGLWFIAETIWLTYTIILGKPLEFSIADITWLLGYIFIFAGLYRSVKPFSLLFKKTGLNHKMKLAYAIPSILGTLLIAITLVNVPEVVNEEGLTTVIVDTSYVILDLVLLTLALKALLFFNSGKISNGLTLFSTGLALLAVSDLPYFVIGGYYPWNILDLLYVISYIVIATGIYIYSRQTPII